MQTIYFLVLVPMVYLAFAIFVAGIVFQVLKVIKRPPFKPTLAIHPKRSPALFWSIFDALFLPTVWRHKRLLWFFLMAFHVSFVLVFLGHLELITEMSWIQVVGHEIFMGRGFLGLIMSLALLYFFLRRFASPTKELSVPEDYFLLLLLFLTVVFGSEMDWARRWYDYGEMSVQEYRSYLSSIFLFRPSIADVSSSGHSFMLVLHVFFANLFLMFFPFSHLMHSIFGFALNKIRRG